jgi:hypothetical protein
MTFETDGAKALAAWSNRGKTNTCPKPRKRPHDFSQAAKLVIDVATGPVEDREPTPEKQGKDLVAVAMGRKGGTARTKSAVQKMMQSAITALRHFWPHLA